MGFKYSDFFLSWLDHSSWNAFPFCLEFFNFWTLFIQLVLPWICHKHDYLQENVCLLFIVSLSFPAPIILRPAISKGDLHLAVQCHCEWQEIKDSELTHRNKDSFVEDEVGKSTRVKIKVIERNERDEVAVLRRNLGERTEILKRSLAMGCVLPDVCLQDLVELHIYQCFWSWFSVWWFWWLLFVFITLWLSKACWFWSLSSIEEKEQTYHSTTGPVSCNTQVFSFLPEYFLPMPTLGISNSTCQHLNSKSCILSPNSLPKLTGPSTYLYLSWILKDTPVFLSVSQGSHHVPAL